MDDRCVSSSLQLARLHCMLRQARCLRTRLLGLCRPCDDHSTDSLALNGTSIVRKWSGFISARIENRVDWTQARGDAARRACPRPRFERCSGSGLWLWRIRNVARCLGPNSPLGRGKVPEGTRWPKKSQARRGAVRLCFSSRLNLIAWIRRCQGDLGVPADPGQSSALTDRAARAGVQLHLALGCTIIKARRAVGDPSNTHRHRARSCERLPRMSWPRHG